MFIMFVNKPRIVMPRILFTASLTPSTAFRNSCTRKTQSWAHQPIAFASAYIAFYRIHIVDTIQNQANSAQYLETSRDFIHHVRLVPIGLIRFEHFLLNRFSLISMLKNALTSFRTSSLIISSAVIVASFLLSSSPKSQSPSSCRFFSRLKRMSRKCCR